jgi:hypothetical protein
LLLWSFVVGWETFVFCSDDSSSQHRDDRRAPVDSVQYLNITKFVEDPENTAALLSMLDETDKNTRYFATKLLTILMANKGGEVQSAILESPINITRLMDLVKNGSEMIRNGTKLLKQKCLITEW